MNTIFPDLEDISDLEGGEGAILSTSSTSALQERRQLRARSTGPNLTETEQHLRSLWHTRCEVCAIAHLRHLAFVRPNDDTSDCIQCIVTTPREVPS
jgi:hypothetical protein